MISKVAEYYDALIDEGNDPVLDPAPLRAYMNRWDGEPFLDLLSLSPRAHVLEIGVGTGRLAVRTAPLCRCFVGIDISKKTVERASLHLSGVRNVRLLCGDFMTYRFDMCFDVVYSSLTFMHIKEKEKAIRKAASLLRPNGRFVLSVDKNESTELVFAKDRKLQIYPDSPDEVLRNIRSSGLSLLCKEETEFAWLFCAGRPEKNANISL